MKGGFQTRSWQRIVFAELAKCVALKQGVRTVYELQTEDHGLSMTERSYLPVVKGSDSSALTRLGLDALRCSLSGGLSLSTAGCTVIVWTLDCL